MCPLRPSVDSPAGGMCCPEEQAECPPGERRTGRDGVRRQLLATGAAILREEGHPDLFRVEVVQDERRVARGDDLQLGVAMMELAQDFDELGLSGEGRLLKLRNESF